MAITRTVSVKGNAAGFVGRVGALAAALGVWAVFSGSADALADSDSTGSVDSASPSARGRASDGRAMHATITRGDRVATRRPRHSETRDSASTAVHAVQSPGLPVAFHAPAPGASASVAASPAPPVASQPPTGIPSPTGQVATVTAPPPVVHAPLGQVPIGPSPAAAMAAPANSALAAVLSPLLGTGTGTPLESPVPWVALAAARRVGRPAPVRTATAAVSTAQPVAALRPPVVSIANATVSEGNSGTRSMTLTVSLSRPLLSKVSVAYATANGTATAGTDYTAAAGTLTFSPGVTSQKINVAIIGDTLVETSETFTVTLSNPIRATLGTATATATITNDDTLPTVSIANATVAEGNSGSSALAFTVSLSTASAGPVTVGYATANGTATAGADYTAISGTLTFSPGVTAQKINVAVTGDTAVEPDETVTVKLSAPSGATLGTASATGTIVNDDNSVPTGTTTKITWNYGTNTVIDFNPATDKLDFGWFSPANLAITEKAGSTQIAIVDNSQTYFLNAVRLDQMSVSNIIALDSSTTALWSSLIATAKQTVPVSVANTAVNEGNSGTANLSFTVSLGRVFDKTVTVAYATSNGTATAGQDYTATSGTLTFAPGVTAQHVNVAVAGDTTVEYDETVALTLSNPTGGAKLEIGSAAGAIANDDVVSGTPPATAQTTKVVAAYFPNYAIYGPNFQIADVPASELTHLFYAFLDVTKAGVVAFADPYGDLQYRFPANETVNGEADLWYYPPEDPRSKQTVWGNMNQLAELKAKYPALHVNISIGGSTLSGNFSTSVATAAGREKLANSIVSFLTTYPSFDGVDFDWEFPGGGGLDTNAVSPNDGANYAALLSLMRTKLDTLGQTTGKRYDLTVASPATADQLATFNLAGLAPSVDFFNVMTYEFHGTWDLQTNHQAAFTGDSGGRDVQTAVENYLAAGIPTGKIVLGAPAYTVAWSGVPAGANGGYRQTGTGEAPGTFSSGMYDYRDLLAQLKDPASGWKLYWDDNGQAPYLYNATTKIFSTFETPTSIAQKSQWAEAMGLRGMMFWDISTDAVSSPDSLVRAAYSSWILHQNLATIRAQSGVKNEAVVGGDGAITVLPASIPSSVRV